MPKTKCKPLPEIPQRYIDKFRSLIEVGGPDECWPYRGKKNNKGYGQVVIYRNDIERKLLANRIAYFLHYGEDPYPFLVCHTCDNPPCCNGKHLFKGTHHTNHEDMANKGRGTRGEWDAMAKLTAPRVLKIRELWASGRWSQPTIGRMFGVTRSTIGQIVRREHWKHI
jgi:hypothetical protein